ncbi:putative monocarboxylate permease-like protein [Venturia nashicola]|uniref:Putative monocarboxylate permease-like protein n=1 Tax=Venturia nashicola TaxID=86259 RepID=A0A4Z1NX09_9PEZI|nr:putative monocarboxylate permease-like protein [Venturia nashicola]
MNPTRTNNEEDLSSNNRDQYFGSRVTESPVDMDKGHLETEADMESKSESREEFYFDKVAALDAPCLEAPREPPKFPPHHPSNNPDGGVKAWLAVFGGFLCLFCSFGWIVAIGVFQDYYSRHQLKKYSPSEISWIPSTELFMLFVGGPIIGKIYDNYGPQPLLAVGTFFHVFGLFMASFAKNYWQILLSQGICSPIGASCVFYPAMSCLATWFFKKRALAMGLMACGSSVGGVVLPIFLERMLPKIGFAWTMRAAALMILGLLCIANVTVRSRNAPSPRPFRLQDFTDPLKEVPYSLTTAGSFFVFLGMFLPFTYLIVQAVHLGAPRSIAVSLVAILNGASFFGRLFPGYVADKIGRYNLTIVMMTLTAVSVFAVWTTTRSTGGVIAFAALYGFTSGAFVSMAPTLIAQISPDMRLIGIRNGTQFAILAVAALIGSPIGGAIAGTGAQPNYMALQVFCGICLAVGVVFMTAARINLSGFKLMVKV